jgi:hypothetical protein
MGRVQLYIIQALVGAGAGITAALVKYISHDHPHILELIELEQQSKIPQLMLGYVGGGIVLLILGVVAVWWSGETNTRKMFAIGLSAPSLFAVAVPPPSQQQVVVPTPKKGSWFIERVITSAYAQQANRAPDCIGDSAAMKGFKLFFGLREPIVGYRVIVGSFKNQIEAVAKAKAVNAEDSTMNAVVGIRNCDSDYYPVVVGSLQTSLDDAKKLAAKAKTLDAVSDVYVSPVPEY